MARLGALSALAVTAALLFSPAAFAGDAEIAYLQSLAGSYTGAGRVSGPDGGDVSCKVVMKASGTRLNYSGRCTAPGNSAAQSFSGAIRYSDQRRRYESSSGARIVPGQKSGSTLTFVTQMETIQGDVNSTMSVSPSSLKMQFRVTDKDGATHQGSIPFRKG